jgi:hypothetical protein
MGADLIMRPYQFAIMQRCWQDFLGRDLANLLSNESVVRPAFVGETGLKRRLKMPERRLNK